MLAKDVVDKIFEYSAEGVFFSRSTNLCYKKIQKVACTSLAYWIYEIEYASRFYTVEQIFSAYEKVKRERNITVKGALNFLYGEPYIDFDLKELRLDKSNISICNSKDVFCFAVVRNPYSRLFSAWADKILRDRLPKNSLYFYDVEHYYKPILNIADARYSIEYFLKLLKENRGGSFCDNHYAPQKYILRQDIVKYDCIAHLEDKDILVDKIRSRIGHDYPSPFYIQENVSPLRYHHDFFTEKAIELIKDLYGCDFREFVYNPEEVPVGKYELTNDYIEKVFLSFLEQRIRNLSRYRYESYAHYKAIEKLKNKKVDTLWRKFKKSCSKRLGIIK